MNIKIVTKEFIPKYQKDGDAGFDIQAFTPEFPIVIEPGKRKLVPTGLFMEIPAGYEVQVRPRSGLALKYGITVLNSPGTIDCGYRGEIGVILHNTDTELNFTINHGDRIAQGVVAKVEAANFIVTEKLAESERGEGGFGHTGVSN